MPTCNCCFEYISQEDRYHEKRLKKQKITVFICRKCWNDLRSIMYNEFQQQILATIDIIR